MKRFLFNGDFDDTTTSIVEIRNTHLHVVATILWGPERIQPKKI